MIERDAINAIGPVDVSRYGLRAGSLTVGPDVTADEAWAGVMEHLAMYLYLRDGSPVDEREVEALAEIVAADMTARDEDREALARALHDASEIGGGDPAMGS